VDDLLTNEDKDLDQKNVRDIKRTLNIDSSYRKTVVYIVAVAEDETQNKVLFIRCSGLPVTQDVYDSARDGFVVCAQEFHRIGSVPVSYKIEIEESEWSAQIPLPMSVIKRYLTEEQKMRLALWKSKFGKNTHRFITTQMLEVY
jgi:hypothetical protein